MIDLAADGPCRRHPDRAGRPGHRQRPVGQHRRPKGIGLLVAALVLLVAFGSLVAMGLPLATALFGVGLGLAAGTLLTIVLDVPEWASSVATMIGLGVGIDYALLIVTRYRTRARRRRRAPRPRSRWPWPPPAGRWCSPVSPW